MRTERVENKEKGAHLVNRRACSVGLVLGSLVEILSTTSPRPSPPLRGGEGGKSKITLLALFCFLVCVAFADDAKPPANTFTGFKAPLEYFDPPHELQVKSFLEGAAAEQLPGGLFLIRDAKLQTFRENGARDMLIQAPQCIFDRQQHTINSAGPLAVQTSDNNLLEGVGFVWTQTNSDLIISNRTHTTIRQTLTNSITP